MTQGSGQPTEPSASSASDMSTSPTDVIGAKHSTGVGDSGITGVTSMRPGGPSTASSVGT